MSFPFLLIYLLDKLKLYSLVPKTPYVKITDRKEAIKYAIENAKKDDVILLAGKGHEDYQIVGKKKLSLDERSVVKKILADL